jgi:hypothetical protein
MFWAAGFSMSLTVLTAKFDNYDFDYNRFRLSLNRGPQKPARDLAQAANSTL